MNATFRKIAVAITLSLSLGATAPAFAGYWVCNPWVCEYVPTCSWNGCY